MSNAEEECLICRHRIDEKAKSRKANKQILFMTDGTSYVLNLCYLHSVEYYLRGQVSFLLKYNQQIENFAKSFDDPVRKYLNKLEESLLIRKKSPWWKGNWFVD